MIKHFVTRITIFFMGAAAIHAKAIEEPAYELLKSWDDPTVEIRYYAPRVLAQTTMAAGENSGFRILAGYIFGGNAAEQEIAMTAPVQRSMKGNPDATMAFMMPTKWRLDELPEPDDERVQFVAQPAYHAIVIRFSGRATEERVNEHWQTLLNFIDAQSLTMLGSPTMNQYDPPWTLPFLRRNEIIMPIEAPSEMLSSTESSVSES